MTAETIPVIAGVLGGAVAAARLFWPVRSPHRAECHACQGTPVTLLWPRQSADLSDPFSYYYFAKDRGEEPDGGLCRKHARQYARIADLEREVLP